MNCVCVYILFKSFKIKNKNKSYNKIKKVKKILRSLSNTRVAQPGIIKYTCAAYGVVQGILNE